MPASLLTQVARQGKFYFLVNAFICLVAFASYRLVQQYQDSSASYVAVYAAGLMRIVVMIKWFDWIGTMKGKIFGDKRMQLTPEQCRSIWFRILWLAVPTECLMIFLTQRYGAPMKEEPLSWSSFPLEFLLFIPKSLAFEIIFDFFHFSAHWICHQVPWLYQHAHKRHHIHLHPCPLSTYEQDIIDVYLTNMTPYLFASYLGFSMSTFQLHLIFAYKTYVEVAGHCGLEIKGSSFPQFPWISYLSICLRVHDHDLHHTHPKFNFAKRFSLWDKVFGTFKHGRPLQETKKQKSVPAAPVTPAPAF
ncbi:Fatty acid hydroxylase, partial [Globisporangium splendens]